MRMIQSKPLKVKHNSAPIGHFCFCEKKKNLIVRKENRLIYLFEGFLDAVL